MMKSSATRLLASVLLAVLAWLALAGAAAKGPVKSPGKLVVLSTTDVKGEIKPCG
jgi:hypothetical protein